MKALASMNFLFFSTSTQSWQSTHMLPLYWPTFPKISFYFSFIVDCWMNKIICIFTATAADLYFWGIREALKNLWSWKLYCDNAT